MIPNPDTLRFLEAIYDEALRLSSGYLLIWTASPKRSAWFRDVERAAEYAARCASDTYVGVGISGKDYGPHERAKSSEIIWLPAFWLDLDIKSPVHKHDDLPETLDEARQLIADVGHAPTLTVNSGHGLQAWWAISDGDCSTEERRQAIAAAVYQWQRHQIDHAKARYGWRIDATHDLARLMRLPGTSNCKAEIVPVVLEAIGV